MTKNSLDNISNTLIDYISMEHRSEIICNNINGSHVALVLQHGFVKIDVSMDRIIVFYADEHDEFLKEPYRSQKEWIQSAGDFVLLLLTHTITTDYYYDKKTNKLLYYRLWAIKGEKRRQFKKVSLTVNPFIIFRPKIIISKVLNTI